MKIEVIQKCCNENRIKWTQHCLERIQERDIRIKDVKHCIMSGEIIEDYPNDYPHPSCLVFGYTVNNKVLHVVVGGNSEFIHIITAYFPNTVKFEADMKTRKRC